MNIKKMSQQEFERYLVLDLIPEIEDEYGEFQYIVMTKKTKIQFAKECSVCHDIKRIDKEYDLPTSILRMVKNEIMSYLETLTEKDVVALNEITECECYEDESYEDEEEDYEEDYELDSDYDEDSYDDYDEY